MEAIPLRMRQRIMALYGQGQTTTQIAATMGTCESVTRRIRQRFNATGSLQPIRSRPGYASGLTADVAQRLRDYVSAEPGATREQLRDRLGVTVDVRTVGRWLVSMGLVLKKSRSMRPNRSVPMSGIAVGSGTRI